MVPMQGDRRCTVRKGIQISWGFSGSRFHSKALGPASEEEVEIVQYPDKPPPKVSGRDPC